MQTPELEGNDQLFPIFPVKRKSDGKTVCWTIANENFPANSLGGAFVQNGKRVLYGNALINYLLG